MAKQMNESKQTRQLCTLFKNCNALVFSVVGGHRQEPGWPDRYIAHKYFQGWIEFKGPGTKSTAKQRTVIASLRSRGVRACFLRFGPETWVVEDERHSVIDVHLPVTSPPEAAQFLKWLNRVLSPMGYVPRIGPEIANG